MTFLCVCWNLDGTQVLQRSGRLSQSLRESQIHATLNHDMPGVSLFTSLLIAPTSDPALGSSIRLQALLSMNFRPKWLCKATKSGSQAEALGRGEQKWHKALFCCVSCLSSASSASNCASNWITTRHCKRRKTSKTLLVHSMRQNLAVPCHGSELANPNSGQSSLQVAQHNSTWMRF